MAYHIVIDRGGRFTKLVYAREDSVRRHYDPEEERIKAEMRAWQKTVPRDTAHTVAHRKRLSALVAQYKVVSGQYIAYTKDSITLHHASRAGRAYLPLLDSLYYASDEQFVDADHIRIRNGQKSIVIHGTEFRLQVISPGRPPRQYTLYAPTSETNPLFVRFLRRTLELYRHDHPDSFMSKRYTRGY